MSRARQALARHPIAWFLGIGNAVAFATALVPPLAELEVTRFELPVFASVGTFLGVGLAAFLITAAADGRAGVVDLLRRSFRWRVPVRWYLLTLFGVPVAATLVAIAVYGGEALESPPEGWTSVILAVLALFVLQFVFFNFVEEIGWTGFFQERLQGEYGPLKLSAVVAAAWAAWHLPDFFVEEGWTLMTLAVSPVFFLFELVSLFFARVLIVWLYNGTGRSVLLVGIFHASFDASISELSREIIPGSDTARILILSGVIVVAATAVIVLTRGSLGQGRGEAALP